MARFKTRTKAKSFRPRRRRVCHFCAHPEANLDYRNVDQLRKFISDRGKIMPRRRTGCCPKHQRELARSIKRARVAAMMPYYID